MPGKRAPSSFLLIALGVFVTCLGCTSGDAVPRDRIGALPFPGWMTLYKTADPAHLGTHRYDHCPRLFRADETERGIIYTERAGFVDLAHVRIAIDWTRFCTRAAQDVLEAGQTATSLPGIDGAVFHVSLTYPEGWRTLRAVERQRLIDVLSRQMGQRVAYLMMTWHEIDTWFGYRTVFLMDESRSAFTWDDSISNLLGMRVAEAAMRDTGRGFDDAATAALSAELRRLGAVTPEQTDQAVRAVEGRWWASGQPLKRQANVCPGIDEVVYPWVVPGLPFCAGGTAREPFPLPRVSSTLGSSLSVRAVVEIEPRIPEACAMRELIPGRPDWFRDDRDVPALVRAMRAQMQAQYGPDVNRP